MGDIGLILSGVLIIILQQRFKLKNTLLSKVFFNFLRWKTNIQVEKVKVRHLKELY